MVPCVDFGIWNFRERFKYEIRQDSSGFKKDTYGNSKNLLDSLKRAYDSGAERIFLVEDDIMVAPDIFEWHETVLNEVDPFVSCATLLNKSAHFPINGREAMDESIKDPNAYHVSHHAYSSHAAAFKRKNLKHVVEFLANESTYEKLSSGNEQDIQIQKIMALPFFINKGSAWPYVPRAFNVGMYSYHINTGMKFNGTFEEKCDALRKAVTNPEKLRSMSAGNQTITSVPTEFVSRTGSLVKR
jgi:hypothetical protein